MKVSNSANLNQTRRAEVSPELQEGEVVKATIKEKLPNNEAIVQVKGKNMQVKFEGTPPKGDSVTIEVTDTEGKIPNVKIVAEQPGNSPATETADATRVIRGLGETPTTELKLAVSMLMEKGLPIDRQMLNDIKLFLDKIGGTLAQKLETLQAVINKQAPMTLSSLTSVHQALHGETLSNLLQQLLVPTQESTGSMQAAASQQTVTPGSPDTKNILAAKAGAMRQAWKEWNTILTSIENEPKLDQLIERVKKSFTALPELDEDVRLPLHKAVKEAEQFYGMGRSQIARNVLTKALDTAVEKLEQDVAALGDVDELADPASPQANYLQNEAMQGIALQSKDFLITQITRRLGAAAEEFKNVQREIVRKLDNLEKSIPQGRLNVLPQVKPLLESTIDMLDRTILKSELTMFTDMSMEKTLMKASTSLSEARKLLGQGENQKAAQLVNEVKMSLDKLSFKPAITRIQHFLAGDQVFLNDAPSAAKLTTQLHHLNKGLSPDAPSARATFEFMRSMGLNHESEVAQALAFNKDQLEPQDLQRNLKATILQVLKQQGETVSQRISDQPIDKLFNNLTGQQLLNKSDTQSSTQSFFFQLPVMLGAKAEDVKVYINGRKEGEKIDWENCSFYFLLETKKIGETGIMLTSVNRNLSISIRNDRPNFKESMQPMVERCKERLKEVGYNISHVQFEKLHQDVPKAPTEERPKEKQESEIARFVTGQKGYDFKI